MIEKGDRVVYFQYVEDWKDIFTLGSTYTVSEIEHQSKLEGGCAIHGPSCQYPGIQLEEVPTLIICEVYEAFYCAGCFRKLGDPEELKKTLRTATRFEEPKRVPSRKRVDA